MRDRIERNLRNYAWYFLVWTVVGLFFFTQAITQKFISREPTPWSHYLVSWLVGVYVWALLTPLPLWLGKHLPIQHRNWVRRTVIHLICAIGISLGQLAIEAVILYRLGMFPSIMTGLLPTFFFLLIIAFHQGVITYFIVIGIQYGISYYRQYQERAQQALRLELNASELQRQLVNAQLGALKMQLQPHFLYNTLNAIMVLVRQEKGKQAEEMLARLSDLLRCVLEDVEAQEVPLRRELEYLRLYLSIEQVRFPDRLRAEISADTAILDAAVPQMGLQPIVENAIRHGIGQSSSAGRIQITAARVLDRLVIKVEDDGPGLIDETVSLIGGIGLKNTRERLRQLYKEAGSLSVENSERGGAVVTISLPYHLAPGISETEVMEVHALHDSDR
jgi:two-component system, LytTR family, sensor kinase